jgi:glycerophosphoryl diester phosphodiesterase
MDRYVIDFVRMVQRNEISKYERPVFRTVPKDGSPPVWSWKSQENPNIGLYIELKRPGYYNRVGWNVEQLLVDALEESEFTGPVIIQSFEEGALKKMKLLKPEWPTVKLCTLEDIPTQEPYLTQFMQYTATYADGIGPDKRSIIPHPRTPPKVSTLVEAAHANNLVVHPYTFRSDTNFLHPTYGGNASLEFIRYFHLGVDAVFADFPDHACFAKTIYERLSDQMHSNRDFIDIFRV